MSEGKSVGDMPLLLVWGLGADELSDISNIRETNLVKVKVVIKISHRRRGKKRF